MREQLVWILSISVLACSSIVVPPAYRSPRHVYQQQQIDHLSVTGSDASLLRWFLEDTRCVRNVDESSGGPLRVEGEATGETRYGAGNHLFRVVEAFTLLPVFGVPFPGGADGMATARVYLNGQFLNSLSTSVRIEYWTTIYTYPGDDAKAVDIARGMALRDLADRLAADLCGERRPVDLP